VKPQLLFEGCPIPVENRIKILGLTMDSLHTMTPQEKKLLPQKAVMDTALSRQFRVQGYGGPLWMPLRASLKHPVPNLQSVQNASLRTVTGCHAAASQQHLHDECRVLASCLSGSMLRCSVAGSRPIAGKPSIHPERSHLGLLVPGPIGKPLSSTGSEAM
jgi:hypothetical protein